MHNILDTKRTAYTSQQPRYIAGEKNNERKIYEEKKYYVHPVNAFATVPTGVADDDVIRLAHLPVIWPVATKQAQQKRLPRRKQVPGTQ